MMKPLKAVIAAAGVLAMAACAEHPYREEAPHHYSHDRYGNRLACYDMGPNQYECLPVSRNYAYPYYYDPFGYDPFWPPFALSYYRWYYPYGYVIYRAPQHVPPSATTPIPRPHHQPRQPPSGRQR